MQIVHRPRVRSLLLATVAVSTVLAMSGFQKAFADGGRGGSDFQGFPGAAGGTGAVGASGGDIQVNGGSAGGGGGGAGGGIGGDASRGQGGNGGNGGQNGASVIGTIANTTDHTGSVGETGASARSNGGGGGGGGGAGGYGLVISGSGASDNSAQVTGGNGGNGGSGANRDIGGGGNGGNGGDGGIGVSLSTLSGANFTNSGVVLGGDGGSGGGSNGGSSGLSGVGGAGLTFDGANGTLINTGTITGGTGGTGSSGPILLPPLIPNVTLLQAVPAANPIDGAGGGNGVEYLAASGAFVNDERGVVSGGTGGSSFGGTGGTGGIGVYFANGGTLLNNGTITGGSGGETFFGVGGNGGVGVAGSNLTITNAASISGGNGGFSFLGTPGGAGGVGIVGSNLIIDNAGSISGGFSGDFATQAYGIQLTGGTNYVGTGGTITGGINVMDNATFQPALNGTPVGTPLVVTGPLVFASTSTFQIRITPTASDSVSVQPSAVPTLAKRALVGNVDGTATLNGAAVRVLAGSGTYTARSYTILTAANGVNGTFSTVSTNLAFLLPTLSYDANNVFLNIVVANATAAGTPDYRTAAATQNQRAVAGGLTNAGMATPGGNGGKILTALNQLTVPQAQAVFDGLSGEGIAAAQNVANRSAELFTSSIFDQTTFYGAGPSANSVTMFDPAPIRELADLPSAKVQPAIPVAPNRTWRAWATGYGGVDNIHGNGFIGSAYQQNTIYGGTLGVDYQLTPNYLVGVALGGSNGDFRVASRATSGSSTGGHVAIYDLATFGAWYGASSSSFSYFGNKTNRTVAGFGGLNTETERGNFNSNELRTRLEFGRHFAGYGGVLTPFVALELAQLRSNGFTETAIQGAGLFRLNVSGQSQASAPAFIGVRLQRPTSIGNGIILSPTLQVAYVHEFAPYRSQIGTIADLPGSTFLIDGARPARNAAQIKAGAEMAIGPRSVIFANFDGELSGVNQLYAGKGGFRYVW